jgi:malonyl CoA-acyl carrier protein transacylase
MAAVIGPGRELIEAVLRASGVDTVDVANFNAPGQTVLAGPTAELDRLAPAFQAVESARFVPLNVRTAFHSRYMTPVKNDFAAFIADFRFNPLIVPVIANFTALPYRDEEIAHNLVQQIDHSVRWVESMQYLLQEDEPVFEELGPGQVLTRLWNEIRKVPVPVNIARRY